MAFWDKLETPDLRIRENYPSKFGPDRLHSSDEGTCGQMGEWIWRVNNAFFI